MNITNIKIKNIKGYGDPGLDWDLTAQPIKSNRINLVVAPNGTGKSSISIAFEYVKGPRITLQEKHFFNEQEGLKSSVSITLDGNTLLCDNETNGIKGVIIPYVINSPLIADTKSHYIPGGGINSTGQMVIENVEMQGSIPMKQDLRVNTANIKDAFGGNSKILRTLNNYLPDSAFLNCIGQMKEIFNKFTSTQMRKNLVNDVLARINAIKGTEPQIRVAITDATFAEIEADGFYQQYIALMSSLHPEFSKLDLFLVFFQLCYAFEHDREVYYKAVKRAEFEQEWLGFNEELRLLNTTGRDIAAKEKENKVVVEYPKADAVSNGQRDLLSFYCRLKEFERSLSAGKKYLLIIDEIFDYLDDANYIAAQYFLTKFMKEKRVDVCVVLMTHLDPIHFRSNVFNTDTLNILYLKPVEAKATLAMTRFITLRQSLNKKDPADGDLYDKMSAYYLHYNPSLTNIKSELEKRNIEGLRVSWGEGTCYYEFIIGEVNKYLSGDSEYDPYAVATALRIRIEKICYDALSPIYKSEYLTGNKCKTTPQKLHFAFLKGVDVNEVFYMAIPLTNDADHLSFVKGTTILDEHPLIYKLDHPVLRHMVGEIFEFNGIALTIDSIR